MYTINYSELACQLRALMEDVPYSVSNLSNASALLWQALPDINWVGFYKRMGDKLILGPFQGKPACIEIPMGRGVCGTAAQRLEPVRVDNVHAFPGHIACDGASNSEIVLPIFCDTTLWGVLDIDSPVKGRFGAADQAGLEEFAAILTARVRWEDLLPHE